MKTLSVNAEEFNEILYPLMATVPAEGGTLELVTVIKVLEKLEARSDIDPKTALSEAMGSSALYKLREDRAKFGFEDAEAGVILTRLEHGAKVLPPMLARGIPGMKAQLEEDHPDPNPDN